MNVPIAKIIGTIQGNRNKESKVKSSKKETHWKAWYNWTAMEKYVTPNLEAQEGLCPKGLYFFSF